MDSITLKGERHNLISQAEGFKIPQIGNEAPNFIFTKKNLTEGRLYEDFKGKIKVLISVPSLDTGVCQISTSKFSEELSKMGNVVGIVISKDLPFAMNRFCVAEGIDNIVCASDFKLNDFSHAYGVEITQGPLDSLCARAVFIVDKGNIIRYAELVEEVTDEPNYEAAMNVLNSLT